MTNETKSEIVIVSCVAAFFAWLVWQQRAATIISNATGVAPLPDPVGGGQLTLTLPDLGDGGYTSGGSNITMPDPTGGSTFYIRPGDVTLNMPGGGSPSLPGNALNACNCGYGMTSLFGTDGALASYLASTSILPDTQAALANYM